MSRFLKIAAGVLALAALALALTGWLAPDLLRPYAPEPLKALLPGAAQEGRGGGRPAPVALARAREGIAADEFATAAEVVAADAVTLRAESAGRVAELSVEDGARLAAGAPVLLLDDDAEQAQVQAAEAQRDEAEADFARARTLSNRNVAAETRVETARAAMEAARSDLAAARAALADRVVRAPFDGEIGDVHISVGAFLGPGDAIVDIASTGRLRYRFDLPAEAARRVSRGDVVRAPTAQTPACRKARVLYVSPLNDAGTRTRTVEATLDDACDLSPGALASVIVTLDRRKGAVLAPAEAVIRQGFDAHVFTVAQGEDGGLVARRRPVETGVAQGDAIEIVKGLEAGARVVARGHQGLRDGDPVAPRDGAAGGGSAGGADDGGPQTARNAS